MKKFKLLETNLSLFRARKIRDREEEWLPPDIPAQNILRQAAAEIIKPKAQQEPYSPPAQYAPVTQPTYTPPKQDTPQQTQQPTSQPTYIPQTYIPSQPTPPRRQEYTPTQRISIPTQYGSYDVGTDFTALLNEAMRTGNADANFLQALLNARRMKTQMPEYAQWADPASDAAIQAYIDNLNANAANLKTAQEWQNYIDMALAQIGNTPIPKYEPTKFDTLKEQLAEKALNMDYGDWLGSEQYGALAKRYNLRGEQSMRDILGQISSRTGGLASSYATSAAQQGYNDYMAKLEQAAYEMFGGEQKDALTKANAAYNYADTDYKRYLDEIAQMNADRSYAYQILSDAIAQSQYAQEWEEAQRRWNYDTGINKAQTLAQAGDFSGYRELGYTDAEIASMQKAYNDAMKPTYIYVPQYKEEYDTTEKKDPEKKEYESDGTENYKVTNPNGESWVEVQGMGRVSWAQLARYVKEGSVREIVDPARKSITYTLIGSYQMTK